MPGKQEKSFGAAIASFEGKVVPDTHSKESVPSDLEADLEAANEAAMEDATAEQMREETRATLRRYEREEAAELPK